MRRIVNDTISYIRMGREGEYSFMPIKSNLNDVYFSNINSQYTDKKGIMNVNVQKRCGYCLPEGISLGISGKEKFFSKLPCQIEVKMLYRYGCHKWVRKGKPRVIGGRKATGPKDNQVFIIRMAELPNTGKARLSYF